MDFYLPLKVLTAFLTPLGFGLLLAMVGLFWARRWLIGLAMVWLWVWSTPWAANRLAWSIEVENPLITTADFPQADAIVVLGGAMSPGAQFWHPEPNFTAAGDRPVLAFQLYKAGKAPILIYSGGPTNHHGSNEAMVGAQLLEQWGVPSASVIIEGDSRTTRENAKYSLPLIEKIGAKKVLLVTSQWHMSRSLLNFRQEARNRQSAIEFIAAPADPIEINGVDGPIFEYFPNTEALDVSRKIFKEYLGILHARWKQQ